MISWIITTIFECAYVSFFYSIICIGLVIGIMPIVTVLTIIYVFMTRESKE